MSGAEAGLVIGLISGIITVLDTVAKVSNAVKDESGLPVSFREIDQRLPLIQDILRTAEERLTGCPLDEKSCKALKVPLDGCKKKAVQLENIFQKAIRPNSSRLGAYHTAMLTVGNGNKVLVLMKGILEDIQLLAGHSALKTATEVQLRKVAEAIAELSARTPEHGFRVQNPMYSASDSGILNIHHGSGHQNISLGGGKQFVAETQYFGTE